MLVSLDFEPTCSVGEAPGDPDCDAAAQWVAAVTGCGCIRLYCDPHMSEVTGYQLVPPLVACPVCGGHVSAITARGWFSRIERIR